jgi:hypothetical protein
MALGPMIGRMRSAMTSEGVHRPDACDACPARLHVRMEGKRVTTTTKQQQTQQQQQQQRKPNTTIITY